MPTISSSRVQPLVTPSYRIVHQRARQPMDSGLRIVFANRQQLAIFLFQADAGGYQRIHFPLGPLYSSDIAFDLDGHSLGERDRFFSNS